MNILFSQLPQIIANVVRPIIGPAAGQFSNGLISLLNVSHKRLQVVVEPTVAPVEGVVGGNTDGGTVTGSYTCGGLIVFTIDLAEYGMLILELQPVN